MFTQIMLFPVKVIGYFGKVIFAIIRLLLINAFYSTRTTHRTKSKFRHINNAKMIALVEYPRVSLPSHVKGGDSSVHDDLIRMLTSAGYQLEKIPYDQNFPVKSQFLKFLIGMPYIYSQIIHHHASHYDLFICDSRVVWDLGDLPVITLFHDSYLGYLKLVGANWNPLGYLNSLVIPKSK
jgi:hypothetical protein